MLWVSIFPTVQGEKEHFSTFSSGQTQCMFHDIFLIFYFEAISNQRLKKRKKKENQQYKEIPISFTQLPLLMVCDL